MRDVVRVGPSDVVILGGTNDPWANVSVSEVRKNLEVITEQALKAMIRPVIALPPPLFWESSYIGLEVVAHRLEYYRVSFRDLVGERKLDMLDFYTPLLDADTGWGKKEYFCDDAHPSLKGYRETGETTAVFSTSFLAGKFSKDQKGRLRAI